MAKLVETDQLVRLGKSKMNERTKKKMEAQRERARKCVVLLRNCGFTVNQIADALGVSRNSVTLFSYGKQCPRKKVFSALNRLATKTARQKLNELQGFAGEK